MSTEEQKITKKARRLDASIRTIRTRSETRARKKMLLEEGVVEDADLNLASIPLPFEINRGRVFVQFEYHRCKLSLTIYHPEAQPFCPLELKSSLELNGRYDAGYWLEMAAIAMQAFSLYAVTRELLPDGDATRIGDDELDPWQHVRYRSVSYWYTIGLRNIDQLDNASVHLSWLSVNGDSAGGAPMVWYTVPQCFADAGELHVRSIEMDMTVLSQFTQLKEVSFDYMNLHRIPIQLREMKLECMHFSGNNIKCVVDEDIEPHLGSLSSFRCVNGRNVDLRGENLSVLLGCCMNSLTRTMDVWSMSPVVRIGSPRRELYEKVKLYHLLTHGLAAAEDKSNDAWSTFLTRGIYDMRLFLFIWPFVQNQ